MPSSVSAAASRVFPKAAEEGGLPGLTLNTQAVFGKSSNFLEGLALPASQ